MPERSPGKQGRSAETREEIYRTALQLFQEKGFEKATMRDIASASGLALGSAYYHFQSKDDIVLEFYKRTQDDSAPVLAFFHKERRLKERLCFLIRYRIGQFAPYGRFLWVLAGAAVAPGNPLSPFSAESADIRAKALHFFELAVSDADPAAGSLQQELPFLLWLYHLGILLFWVVSQDQRKTDLLLEETSVILVFLVRSARLPVLRGLAGKIRALVRALR